MIISLIVAMAENRTIGRDNSMPWHLSEDLKRFRKITSGSPIVMGRKTFESVGSRPLPKRLNLIVTRDPDFSAEGVEVVSSLEKAYERCEELSEEWGEEVFICGGAEIYRQTLDSADKLYLTIIHKDIEGDTFFPKVDFTKFKEVEREDRSEPMAFSFVTYERIR